MASSLHTVSFVTPAGEEVVSRFFSQIRYARKCGLAGLAALNGCERKNLPRLGGLRAY
jgi:hypothetical protein